MTYEWKIIYEKGREWKKEINHELLIPQFNYAMIKGKNLINQLKEDSMKTRKECKIFDMNYISSVFNNINDLLLKACALHLTQFFIHAIFIWSMFCHHQKERDCWLQDDFDDNETTI